VPVPHSPTPTDAPSRRAVIDVGTNSVKLLVGDVFGSHIVAVHERGLQTRLGEGSFESHLLSTQAIARTAEVVAAFHAEALRLGSTRIGLLATAAARDARNAGELRDALFTRTGLELRILSGVTEAEMGFRGVCTQDNFARGPVLVTDLGGGSTEFIVGQDGSRKYSRSFPLGAVRLLETLRPPPDPNPDDLAHCRDHVNGFFRDQVLPEVAPALKAVSSMDGPARHIGVGGAAGILARMAVGLVDFDRDRIEATTLSAADLTGWVERLWSMPLEQRRQVPGLPPERADVMLTGAVVHESILLQLGLPALAVSTRGLRFAALLEHSPAPPASELSAPT
jgi:exopolyphosphatase/guanosine-5'-triphosphate,3'-diphosphate pyrophosphatase